MRKQVNEMAKLKYKLATGFPVISITSGEDVHLQFARQMQPGDWIEWPAFERDAKRMLNYLLDVGIVPYIDQRDEGSIRFTVKEPGDAVS